MTQIGGTTKKKLVKPVQPQYVVQIAEHLNQYAQIKIDEEGNTNIFWIGDPYAATKFDSKYAAKLRTREIVNVPETRVFRELEIRKA